MQLTADRHLGAWSGTFPTALVHLPSGLGLKVSTYSSRAGGYEDHRSSATVRLLEKTAAFQRLEVEHAGTRVAIDAIHVAPTELLVRLRRVQTGEWPLRFWYLLEIGRVAAPTAPAIDGTPGSRTAVSLDERGRHTPAAGRAAASWRSTSLAVHTAPAPARAGAYADLTELRDELLEGGYYRPHDDADDPRWAVLRFSSQEQAEVVAAVVVSSSDEEAAATATASLGGAAERFAALDAHTDADLPLAAVRDVVAWNTVWDPDNGRPYTALTRNWLGEKFGGYGIWLNDVAYGALLAAVADDPVIARENLRTVLAGQQPAGNLPCLLTANEEWVDRSQPPIVGFLLRRIHARWPDHTLLHEALPALRRNHDWWMRVRDGNGDGLIEYGSSPTGHGTFAHTRQGAMNEASMDNLPMFDDVDFDPASATLMLEDPGLNSLLVLEAESLAALYDVVGDAAAAEELRQRAAAHAARIRERLWDPARRTFAARRWDGGFVRSLSPTSFYPLAAGVASPEQAAALVEQLLDERTFWGPRPLPASTFDDPASADRVYWRGRIWPPMVYLTWEGLRRYGFDREAAEVAERAWTMFADGWRDRRCLENLDPDGPDGDASSDTDDFYTWGALLPLVASLQRADVDLGAGARLDASAGPVGVTTAGRRLELAPVDGGARLTVDGRSVGTVRGATALRDLEVTGDRVRLACAEPGATFSPTVEVAAVRTGDGQLVTDLPDPIALPPGEAVTLIRC